MEGVEQFQIIKVDHCTLFNVLISVPFDFKCHTTFNKVRMRIDEIVRKIAQKFEKHIFGET